MKKQRRKNANALYPFHAPRLRSAGISTSVNVTAITILRAPLASGDSYTRDNIDFFARRRSLD